MYGTDPFISIIVSVLNGAKTLERCIDSVSGQTYARKQLIVMDGGSTDSTVELIKANEGKITYWESARDRGIYHAWNKALKQATGEWIHFLGADDYFWSHDVLERMSVHLKSAAPKVRVVYGRVALVNDRGHLLEIVGQPWESVGRRFLQYPVVPHQGVFHHRDLFSHGGFDEAFSIAGDYELLLRELRQGEAWFVPHIVVAGRQLGGVSSSPLRTLTVLREIACARRKHRIPGIPWVWGWICAKAVARRILISLIGEKNAGYVTDFYRRISGRVAIWTR